MTTSTISQLTTAINDFLADRFESTPLTNEQTKKLVDLCNTNMTNAIDYLRNTTSVTKVEILRIKFDENYTSPFEQYIIDEAITFNRPINSKIDWTTSQEIIRFIMMNIRLFS